MRTPKIYRIVQITDEVQAQAMMLCGVLVHKSNILSGTWYAWFPVVEEA